MKWCVIFIVYLFNIFFLDRDPDKAARGHAQKHLNKMILEYTQACCTVLRLLYLQEGREAPSWCYRATHAKHPVTLWVRESLAHYLYLIELGKALARERKTRKARCPQKTKSWKDSHLCEPILELLKENAPRNFPSSEWLRDPPLLAPKEIQDMGIADRVEANRTAYVLNKLKIEGNVYLPFVDEPDWVGEIRLKLNGGVEL